MDLGKVRFERGALERFLTRCSSALEVIYKTAVHNTDQTPQSAYAASAKYLIRMLAVLVAAQQVPSERSSAQSLKSAAQAILDHEQAGSLRAYEKAIAETFSVSSISLFESKEQSKLTEQAFGKASDQLLGPDPDAHIGAIYFQTMPLSWIGCAHQHLLTLHPDETGDALVSSRSRRKGGGVFFTPPYLVTYIIESVLSPLAESLGTLQNAVFGSHNADLKILDPSMGGGDFLTAAVNFLSGSADKVRAQLASSCVYGIDVDPMAVDVSRFCVWATSMYADDIANQINSHLICADALGSASKFDWLDAFPEVFADIGGFDAVVGNPPYIASKNGMSRASVGQSDTYLLFLSTVIDEKLVKPGGMFSMVLPDPMLVRENAAEVRRRLISDWTIQSLLHISGVFPDAHVTNVVPVCRNTAPVSSTFTASRIERSADRRRFSLHPRRMVSELALDVRRETVLAQRRYELLYLLEAGSFGGIIHRIHGEDAALTKFQPPFVPLAELNVRTVYRGEEVGKSAIVDEDGDLPMLLGGQSIRPFEVVWEGRRINRPLIKKSLDRYSKSKILIQKSSSHLIAAFDQTFAEHSGYVFPQSVYAVELNGAGMDPLYLLCLLNSEVMNEYIRRTVTGYKLLQPQLELEDIRSLPIRRIEFTTPQAQRTTDAAKGISIFESELLRAGESVPFAELSNFVVSCLTGVPEESDVVHDVLVHLGGLLIELTKRNRQSPDTDTTRSLELTRTAIETIIWKLYSSEPAQMTLPW